MDLLRGENLDFRENELSVLFWVVIESWRAEREWSQFIGEFDTIAYVDASLLSILEESERTRPN